MPMTLKQIEQEITLLPEQQMEKLYDFISLHRTLSEHDRQWGEESQRRYEAYLAGKTEAHSADEVFKKLRKKYK